MRRAVEIGSGLVTTALLGVGLTGWQVPEDWRPWLLVAAGVFAAITILAAIRLRGEGGGGPTASIGPSSSGQAVAQLGQGSTLTQIAGDQIINPPSPPHDEFADAPHLMWSGLQPLSWDHMSYEFTINCNNVGKTAQMIRAETWVTSTVDVFVPEPGTTADGLSGHITQQVEDVRFAIFDTGGQISPGAFTLHIQCHENEPLPGEREIRWRVTYMDDDLRRGYITECSARIAFALRSPSIIGEPAYDMTSRKQRNDDYNKYMRDKRAPSTGLRREP